MKTSILDCTLRDGGYVNNFRFGVNRIQTLTEKLCAANIEMIECGFMRTGKNDPECSLYGSVDQIKLPEEREGRMFLAMIAYGEITAGEIAPRKPENIDGIRLSFHNDEWEETKVFALDLMEKGYIVFIQPIGTISYTDMELLNLIEEVNKLKPFALYMVDTLGSMYKNDLYRMFYLLENNLNKDICIGYHAHNNLQLAFANAMSLLELHTDRHLIFDSSVFGMGRGAGNLNTELITHFINSNIEDRYNLVPLLEIIDDIILPINAQFSWGFSEPYYLSAIMGVHPNYASYLLDKHSMNMTKIFDLLSNVPGDDKHLFIKKNIEELYHAEMSHVIEDSVAVEEIAKLVGQREVLVLAPGSSIKTHVADLKDYINTTSPYVIALNFVPDEIAPDLIFVSNRKRFERMEHGDLPIAVTSNIGSQGVKGAYVIDYDSLLRDSFELSGIMVLRFLLRLGIEKATLAGYDGFTGGGDYYRDSLEGHHNAQAVDTLNESMNKQLMDINEEIALQFITPTPYKVSSND